MKYVKYLLIVWVALGVLFIVLIFVSAIVDLTGNHIPENKAERIVSRNGYEFTKYHPDLREYWAYNKDFQLTETCSVDKYARLYVIDFDFIQYTCDDTTLGYNLKEQEISQLEQKDIYHSEVEVTPTKQKQNEELFEAEFSEDAKIITEQYNS